MSAFDNQTIYCEQGASAILQYHLSFEKLLNSIFSRFLNTPGDEFDQAIDETLKEIGTFVKADRAYLFIFSEFKQVMSNTHEWCAEGIFPQKESLQNLPLRDYSWTINELSKSNYLYIPLVKDMEASAQNEKATLARQGIQSLLMVPLRINSKINGFLGFDAVTMPRSWSEKEIDVLSIVAKILVYDKKFKRSQDTIDIAQYLLNSIGEGIFIIGYPDMITWTNQAFTEISGYAKEELLFKPHQFLNLVERDFSVLGDMHQKLSEQGSWHGILNGRHKDGHIYPASLSISTTGNQNEQTIRHLVIFRDLTEHLKLLAEREKLQKHTLTAQKLNSLSTMSAGVVHEIAQPLNSIKVLVDGMLYCRRNNYELSADEIFEKLGEVSTEIKRIDEIIQHMRSFASLNTSTELSYCSWNVAVERALGLLGRQLAAHEIAVKTVLLGDLPLTFANPNRLDEVLLNILVNSMQALDSSLRAEKAIICKTYASPTHSILEIADNGTGIDESIHSMIFEPFFTTKMGGNGMGMGLSIVDSIMNSLKGQITVFNNHKGGATFRLELPIAAR